LDVAASGVNRVERESVSHEHPSRFVLVGSMNPEEGDLRPQLLDRFGLAVDVLSSSDPAARAEVVERRMAFDADPAGFAARWAGAEEDLRRRVSRARPVAVPSALVRRVSSMCASVGAEGLRADLVICRAAAALTGWDGLAVGGTVRAAAARRAGPRDAGPGDAGPGDGDEPLVTPGDLRLAVREQRTGNLVVLCVDASGSMGGARRMEAAKGAVLSLLLDAYQRRDRVAVVTFRDRDAEVVLRPTGSVEVARARLRDLPTGGRT